MAHTADLATLAQLAGGDVTDDGAVERALEVVRGNTGAESAIFVYSAAGEFRHITSGGDLTLTPVALWLIQRDLVTRGNSCAFDKTGARVVAFRSAEASSACEYVAFLLPAPKTAVQLVILRGPWPEGFREHEFVVAAQPALAIITGKRIEHLQVTQDRHELSALMNIAQVISQSQDIEQVLTDIARGVAAFTGVEYVTIDVTNEHGDASIRCVNYDIPTSEEGVDRWKQAIARPDPIRREVVRSRRPVLFADSQNDERLPAAARMYFKMNLVRSTAIFPMIAQDEVIGVLSIGARRPMEFSKAECSVFEGLASQAATAVSGIRLLDQLAQKSALLEQALQAEQERAQRDSLTGVWNHAATTDLLQQELNRPDAGFITVAMIDVDGMKAVNDTFGHLAGDDVLIEVARCLSRDGAIVGRYGGDEFLVLLPGQHRAYAEVYTAEVLDQVSKLGIIEARTGAKLQFGISVGLAVFPDEGTSVADLIRVADAAMYATKSRSIETTHGGRRLSDRVSHLIDDLVPLLTSAAGLEEKLRLVTQRLSDGTGYDAVDCRLYPSAGGAHAHWILVDGKTSEVTEAWRREQRAFPMPFDRPASAVMNETRRPLLISEMSANELFTPKQKRLLEQMGVRSILGVPMIWQGEMIGLLSVGSRQPSAFQASDAQFLSAISTQVTAIVRMATLVDGLQSATHQLKTAQDETVMMLAAAAEAHDHTTGLHLQSIRVISEALGRELGYDDAEVHELGLAATLHDIGKISVPDSILSSPVRFDRDDWETSRIWEQLKRHSTWGAEFLEGRKGFELASQVARWHHESWDGRGYPDGIAGDAIPERVAIVTVADAFDAMTSERPYREAQSAASALDEIIRCRGKQFSPVVVDALARLCARGALGSLSLQRDAA